MSQEAARSQADPEGRARVMFSMVPQFLISSMDKQVSLLGLSLALVPCRQKLWFHSGQVQPAEFVLRTHEPLMDG